MKRREFLKSLVLTVATLYGLGFQKKLEPKKEQFTEKSFNDIIEVAYNDVKFEGLVYGTDKKTRDMWHIQGINEMNLSR